MDSLNVKKIYSSHDSLVQHGIHEEDFSRPMYKKDVFYTGSVHSLAEFKKHNKNITEFTRSSISVAAKKKEAFCAQSGAASKFILDIVKEMTDFKLLGQNKGFLLITLANFFAFCGFFSTFIYLPIYANELHWDKSRIPIIPMIIGK